MRRVPPRDVVTGRALGRLLVVVALLAGCGASSTEPRGGESGAAGVEALRAEVVATFPHDPDAFTQGLELDGDVLLESVGLYGRSALRLVDRVTGSVVTSQPLDASVFAEGATLVDGEIVQLTWKEGVAYRWDATTLEPRGTHTYTGEGWGLCADGDRLVMSDGSDRLTFREPETFAVTGHVRVRQGDRPVEQLNELECVDGAVYANVWQTDRIVRIDPDTGRVTATIDASGLLSPAEAEAADVLNGIAHDPVTGRFLVTGKLWPTVFEVRFVPA